MATVPSMMSFFRHRGGSGEIRGSQVAKYLGAKINPASGYEQDICIYVKIQPPEDFPGNSYLDIVDGQERITWLRNHPKIGIIANSITGTNYLMKVLNREDIVYIPHHHCNYERIIRAQRKPEIVGVVGGNGALMNQELMDKLNIVHTKRYKVRQDVVDAYKKIDIQVVWRESNNPLKSPLKIINAASFGIPTVAYYSPVYQEMGGYYYPVNSTEEAITKVEELKRNRWDAMKLINKAEKFHIEHISKLYLEYL